MRGSQTPPTPLQKDLIFLMSLWKGGSETLYWANYKDDTYVGTSDGSCQLPGPCTGTSLRPVKGIILGYILGLKLPQDMGN